MALLMGYVLVVTREGLSGGLGLWWKEVDVNIISHSRHHITVKVRDSAGHPVWAAVGVYGWPETENKYRTWELMRAMKEEINLPMVLLGDFNEITNMREKGAYDG